MERKLASIRQVNRRMEIPKAENIEMIFVDGWQLIAKKGEFKTGDLCVFFEVDSILPINPVFAFMERRKFKVKTAKFMKQISQGLALPTSILKDFNIIEFKLGDDVTEAIGVTKYDPEANRIIIEKMRANYPWWKKILFRYKYTRNVIKYYERKSSFPSDIVKKTDEERIQNMTLSLDNYVKKVIDITEKLDGQSATYIYRPNYLFPEVIVCSRNQILKNPNNSSCWTIFRKDKILNKLKQIHKQLKLGRKDYIIFQGEIIGMSIQKNKYKLNDYHFYLFNLKTNIKGNVKQYGYHESGIIIHKLEMNLKQVPFTGTIDMCNTEQLIKSVKSCGELKSNINPDLQAEGIVCRVRDEQQLSFKYINPKFRLKWDKIAGKDEQSND